MVTVPVPSAWEPAAPAGPVASRVPVLRVTPPLKVLLFESIRVPRPALVMLDPAPVTTPARLPVMFGALTVMVVAPAGRAIVVPPPAVATPPMARVAAVLVVASKLKLPVTLTALLTVCEAAA